MILNLKELNKYIEYHHFKMDSFETALKLVRKDCYTASVDLRARLLFGLCCKTRKEIP